MHIHDVHSITAIDIIIMINIFCIYSAGNK